ncbi:hypothetical protein AB4144_50035, partial [Rhizobiaceae sp. 2RAB30]
RYARSPNGKPGASALSHLSWLKDRRSNRAQRAPGPRIASKEAPTVAITIDLGDADKTTTVGRFNALEAGSGNQNVTISVPVSGVTIDLGGGTDSIIFAKGSNTATISNVETIRGNTGADTITLGTTLTSGKHIDLGAGDDMITLSN